MILRLPSLVDARAQSCMAEMLQADVKATVTQTISFFTTNIYRRASLNAQTLKAVADHSWQLRIGH